MYNRYRPSNMISTSGISEIVALVPERYLDKQGHGKQFPSLPGSLARPSLTPSCCSHCGHHHWSDCLLAPVKPHLSSTSKTPFLPSSLPSLFLLNFYQQENEHGINNNIANHTFKVTVQIFLILILFQADTRMNTHNTS